MLLQEKQHIPFSSISHNLEASALVYLPSNLEEFFNLLRWRLEMLLLEVPTSIKYFFDLLSLGRLLLLIQTKDTFEILNDQLLLEKIDYGTK